MDLAMPATVTDNATPGPSEHHSPLFWQGEVSVINWWILFVAFWFVKIAYRPFRSSSLAEHSRESSTLAVSLGVGRRSLSYNRELKALRNYDEYGSPAKQSVRLPQVKQASTHLPL